MNRIGIYRITSLIDNKVYIGQSIRLVRRLIRHRVDLKSGMHINKHLQAAYNKHGRDNFHFSIVEECMVSELNDRESHWINHYNSLNNENGYNMLLPGEYPIVVDRKKKGPKKRLLTCVNFITMEELRFNSIKELRDYFNWNSKKIGDVIRYWKNGHDKNTAKSYKNWIIMDSSIFELLGKDEVIRRSMYVKRNGIEFKRKFKNF